MSSNHEPKTSPPSNIGIIERFARHPVAANLLMLLMILSGIFALGQLNRQFFPNFELEQVMVSIPWRGASAEDVERSITVPIEQELSTLTGIKSMKSTSVEGHAQIILEIDEHESVMTKLEQVKQRVATVRNLPSDAEEPVITQMEFFRPIANLMLSGPVTRPELQRLAREYEKSLKDAGIKKISFSGLPEEEIRVEIPTTKLSELGLPMSTIADKIRAQSQDLPVGTVGRSDVSRQIRSLNQKRDIRGFEDLSITTTEGNRFLLRDIAIVRQVPIENQPLVTHEGQPAIEMILMRTKNQDTLEMAETLKQWVSAQQISLPKNITLDVYNEQWRHLEQRINLLLENGAGGLVLVILTLFLFLNQRVAFWVTVGIPVSFLATLAVLWVMGGSINMISLFALIMALGIIVDDSIVVGENVLSLMEQRTSPLQSAVMGAKKMFAPVLSSSLTSIAAFLPLVMIGGTMGKFILVTPLVVIAVILASLIECFLVLPGHLYHSMKKPIEPSKWQFKARFNEAFDTFRAGQFRKWVEYAINYRWITILIAICTLILTLGLISTGKVKFTFFPPIDGSEIKANVKFLPGTSEDTVDTFLIHLIDTLKQLDASLEKPVVNKILKYQYLSQFQDGSLDNNGPEHGSVVIDLIAEDRIIPNKDLIARWKANIKQPPGIESFTISQREAGPPGKAIAIKILGADILTLEKVSITLQKSLSEFAGLSNIDDDLPYGKEQWIYHITPTGSRLNLTIQDIGRQIRAALDGELIQIVNVGAEEIEVRVTLPEHERDHSSTLEFLPIVLSNGDSVPLTQVANFSARRGISKLQREDGQLALIVSADVDIAITNANEVMDALREETLPKLQAIYSVSFGSEGRAADQDETLRDMKRGMLLGLTLIFIILAWVFGAYSWPIAVMSAIPFGLIGAVMGHLIMGRDLSFFSLLGLFGLSGIVINDSIVLITFYKTLRTNGLAVREAIIEAIVQRLRAVLLTSLTTMAGLIPLLFETSLQAQFLIPMAISLVFGLGFATFIILFFVPALLVILENANERRQRSKYANIRG